METNAQYFDCLCRTCMNKVESSSHDGSTIPPQQWLSIFDLIEECGTLRIAELLSDAVPQIVVQPSDELPKKICTECLQRLLSVYRFQQMCVESDKQMHEVLSKERIVLKTPMLEETIKGEKEANDADSEPLKELRCSSTLPNLQQPSIQEPLAEVTVQTIEPEAAQSSAADHLQDNTQLLEHFNDSQGEFEEFIKNEPIEDDEEANSEYSDGDTIHSTISVTKEEVLPIEFEDQQVNDAILAEPCTTHIKDKPYECPHCPLRFNSKSSVWKHKAVHKKAKGYECDICGKVVKTKPSLIQHKLIHSKEKRYKCDFCEKRCTHMAQLQVHIRTHTGEKPFKCKYCERGFSTNSPLNYHLRSHLGENIHRCKFCPLAFPSSVEMRLHLPSHKNENPEVREQNLKALQEEEAKLLLKFSKEKSKGPSIGEQQQQKLSNKKIEQPSTDIPGEQRTTHAEDKPYECPYCPLRFSSRPYMASHKKTHEEIKPHKCGICGKMFRRKSDLMRHKRTHSNEKPHKCDQCEMRFIQMQDLKNHIRTHTGEKPYKCKYCERGFAASSTLHCHLRRHLGKNIHRCKFCPLGFPSFAEMHLHLTSHKNEDQETRERNLKALKEEEVELELKLSKERAERQPIEVPAQQHTTYAEDKPYECPYCPLRFSSRSEVSVHKTIHEGIKPHKCSICGDKFRLMHDLTKHKRIHSKGKPHKCDLCERRFTARHYLKTHIRTHTGETPYKCKYCEHAFAAFSTLRYHLRSHLGKNIYRCKLCPLAFPSNAEMRLHFTSHKNEGPEVRERNLKALQEEEAKLKLKFSKEISKGQSTEQQQQEVVS